MRDVVSALEYLDVRITVHVGPVSYDGWPEIVGTDLLHLRRASDPTLMAVIRIDRITAVAWTATGTYPTRPGPTEADPVVADRSGASQAGTSAPAASSRFVAHGGVPGDEVAPGDFVCDDSTGMVWGCWAGPGEPDGRLPGSGPTVSMVTAHGSVYVSPERTYSLFRPVAHDGSPDAPTHGARRTMHDFLHGLARDPELGDVDVDVRAGSAAYTGRVVGVGPELLHLRLPPDRDGMAVFPVDRIDGVVW